MKIRDRIKELRRVKASELHPNPKNWRTHPKQQLDALRGVLAEVGFAGAELARELPDGSLQLIDGHARAEIAGDAEIPVLILDVTESEADKILATFDPLGAMAEADAGKLEELLREVQTGSEALAEMLSELAEDNGILDSLGDAEITEDEVPEPPVDPITKPGDLWILGNHRLLCGDSTSEANALILLGQQKAAAVITDPPYGVDYSSKNEYLNKFDKGNRNQTHITNDALKPADLSQFLAKVFAVCMKACRDGGAWYIASPPGPQFREFANELNQLGVWRQTLIWVKSNFVLGRSDYKYQHEPIFYGWKPGASHSFEGSGGETTVFDDAKPRDLHKLKKEDLIEYCISLLSRLNKEPTTVLRYAKPQSSEDHPTMKPVKLMARLIRNSTKKSEIIYEPFCGSGTTLIAAEQLGRKCYGMEISPQYCDVIVKRWENLTGKKAVLENGHS